jgi:hypothetical protein
MEMRQSSLPSLSNGLKREDYPIRERERASSYGSDLLK